MERDWGAAGVTRVYVTRERGVFLHGPGRNAYLVTTEPVAVEPHPQAVPEGARLVGRFALTDAEADDAGNRARGHAFRFLPV